MRSISVTPGAINKIFRALKGRHLTIDCGGPAGTQKNNVMDPGVKLTLRVIALHPGYLPISLSG